MWNRACPLCYRRVPRTLVLSRSDELSCPSCHAELELSRPSRVVNAWVGVAAAFLAASAVSNLDSSGAWALAPVAAVVAFGAASVLALVFLADLVVRPKEALAFPHAHK